MSDSQLVFFHRPSDESKESFGKRMRDLTADVAKNDRATAVVLYIDDGEVGAPPEAAAYASTYDAALAVTGVPVVELPTGDARFEVSRRVIKARPRGKDGERSAGFTIICPSVRADFLDHDQFNAHWRDNHSKVHVASSPGTCHYEQHIIDKSVTPGAPGWDGVGFLSFASAADHTDGLFSGPEGQKAIMDDVARFLDLDKGETLPASEFVFRDGAS